MPSIETAKYNPNNKGYDKPTTKHEIDPEDFLMVSNFIKDTLPVTGFYKVTITTDNGVALGLFTPHPDLVGYLKARSKKTPNGKENNN